MKKTAGIIATVGATAALGCGHGPRAVSDPDPADKIPAIKQAVEQHDRRAIPQLIKDLDNDDPAVRFYTIDALHSLANEDFGYRYFDDADARKPAIEKWNQWLAQHPAP